MLTTENFLEPGEYLIYIANRQSFADAEGVTHVARKLRDYIEDDSLWYDFILETDVDGDRLTNPVPITVSANRVVSEREFREISPKEMYHFATSSNLGSFNGSQNFIQARSFVIKSNVTRPLESTSRSALGSGIYGIYSKNVSDIMNLRTSQDQAIYNIDCSRAYPIQDREHGESLTVASLNTNRYLDSILELFNEDDYQSYRDYENIKLSDILSVIESNQSPKLFTLWNIVLYRTYDSLSQETLNTIMAQYVLDYLTDFSLTDSVNGNPINELPINRILGYLGYDGIIADDPYNNGWDRGCVSYNYNQAQVVEGEFARY